MDNSTNTLRATNRHQEYVEKFDEFLIRCNALSTKGQSQILFRFRARLREDLRTKLLAREITELEKAYALVQDLDAAKSSSVSKNHIQTTRPNSGSYPNHFQSQTSSHKADTKGKSIENKGKGTNREFSKLTLTIKCYKGQGNGHVAANCSTPVNIALVNGVPEVVSESDLDEFIFQGEDEHSDIDDEITVEDIGLNFIRPATVTHLFVVRCALSQPKKNDDWRWITIFHIIMKIGGKSCKIIVDNGSCINAVSSTVIIKFSLKAVPHPYPYQAMWINLSTLEVKQRYLVPIDFGVYKDKI